MCTKCIKCRLNSTQSREILESKIHREPAGTMHGLGWDVEEVLHKCNIWSRSYSCPSQVPAAPVPGVSCLTNICGLCHPVSQTVVPSGLGAGLSGHDWEVQCWMDRWNRTLPRKFPKFHMGHINSPPLNILITFLNTHLVRKGVGWHYISFSFPSASACQFPFQFFSPLSFFSVTPWVPRASPSSSFTSLLCTQKIQQRRGHCPHIAPVLDICCAHLWHFWARRGCAGLCLLSTKCCRDWSTTGAPSPRGAQHAPAAVGVCTGGVFFGFFSWEQFLLLLVGLNVSITVSSSFCST